MRIASNGPYEGWGPARRESEAPAGPDRHETGRSAGPPDDGTAASGVMYRK